MEITTDQLLVHRLPLRLTGDSRRTIMRFFWPGNVTRARKIFHRVSNLNDVSVKRLLHAVAQDFSAHHPDFEQTLLDHFYEACERMNLSSIVPMDHRLLIGAYFTMEYAFESAALFNPSIVPAIDQRFVPPGYVRFLMSLRAVGEGHLSSIVFRRGLIDPNGNIEFEPTSSHSRSFRKVKDPTFEKKSFRDVLIEMKLHNAHAERILHKLPDPFTYTCLIETIGMMKTETEADPGWAKTEERLVWMAKSNYEIEITAETELSEVVLFPLSQSESHGMEDMRLVRLIDDKGVDRFCGTYTAFDGSRILPQMMEYTGEDGVEIFTLHGEYARNKGMALFPRQIEGKFMMIARVDGENLYLLWSDNILIWNQGKLLDTPKYPWEFVQIGNCGPPIETSAGWLVLTHGVGPMRRYCMGAILLDRLDPSRIIGRLDTPLLTPTAEERAGYVPNVVYSCGAMVHNGNLIIPYGISDAATGFAIVCLDDLLAHIQR